MNGIKPSFNKDWFIAESLKEHPFQWIDQMDESVSLLKWEGYKAVLLIAVLSLAIIANAICRGLTINYLLKFAPPDRPINTLTFFEQVSDGFLFITFNQFTMLQKVSNCEVKAARYICCHSVFMYVKSNFGEFKHSKMSFLAILETLNFW